MVVFVHNWKIEFAEMSKLLKDLNAYVECRDFKNAHHMAELLKFKLTFDVLYEEERIKGLKKLAKKGD